MLFRSPLPFSTVYLSTASALLLISASVSAAGQEEGARSTVLPDIEVSASANLPVGQSRLNQENIDQQQADNLAALLDLLPGTSMSGSPRPGGQTLNIWGMGETEDVKVSIDGAAKNFERYRQGSVFIEPELLKQITVDKGAFDAARGNGGFGGAVKLESRDAADLLASDRQFGALLKSSYHSNDEQWQHSGAVYGRNRDGSFDGLLYASVRRGHDIEQPDGSRFAFSANRQQSFLLKTNYSPSEFHRLTLSAIYGKRNGWEPFAAKRGDMTPPTQREIDRYGLNEAWRRKLLYRKQNDQSYTLRYRYTPDHPWVDIRAQLSHAQTSQRDRRPENGAGISIGTMGNASETTYRDSGIEVSNTARFTTGGAAHALQSGLQFNRNTREVWMYDRSKRNNADYNYGHFQPYYMPSGRQYQYSFYIQDDIRIGDWTLSPALRYDYVKNQGTPNAAPIYNTPSAGHDYSSKSHSGWSPFFGISWQPSPAVLLFANVSRTWRAPLIDEQYEVQSRSAGVSGSAPHLKPERITSLRVGGQFHFRNLLQEADSLQLRTTLFRLRGQDEIFKNRGIFCEEQAINGGSSSACSQYKPLPNNRNLPAYTIKGGELEAYYESANWFGSLSYSFLSGKRRGSMVNPWFPEDTWLTDIPPRKATAVIGWRHPQSGFSLGWRGEFVRRQDRSPADIDPKAAVWALPKSRGYALHGLFAAWQPPHRQELTVRLTADNIFNRRYAPYLGEAVSGVGRNIKASVSWRF
ncbi:TonB-dependent hemoglobin/transferrin/lactoferrin family receptor [Neisseria shayeganii]|uniref:TonB-dependent hemoglobin/transferrin/lactoferrin family receptor n=1 Tax=Neisseria shayeganii TaxID=607712 RepID=A0A7D7NBI4_9NEIS|nr:TonB-dependent hemoglobin/transferrin/lactoferrin family receptor [Neisseria shayeganii]QMT41439.1 TonB-dependent hemoglobin/transferrin/lactoferrin family receptor [Neisseria shayeganii]